MGSKLVLFIFLAKLMTIEDMANIGIFISSITIGVLLLGGEFYTYSQRELVKRNKKDWSFVFKNHLFANSLFYLVFIPPSLYLFFSNLLPFEYIYFFYIILVLEHVSQEILRLLILMEKQIVSSYILLVRSAFWIWISIVLIYNFQDLNNLNTIFYTWAICVFISVILGIIVISKNINILGNNEINILWIKKGYTVAYLFLISTISYQLIFTLDRYIIKSAHAEQLGVYVFFISLMIGLNGILQATVISYLYPKLISFYEHSKFDDFFVTMKELLLSIVFIAIASIIFLSSLIPYLLEWVNQPIYMDNIYIFYILMLVFFFFALSQVAHQGLYAMRADFILLKSNLYGLIIFVIFCFIFSLFVSKILYSVSLSLLVTFIYSCIYKYYYYNIYAKKTQRIEHV